MALSDGIEVGLLDRFIEAGNWIGGTLSEAEAQALPVALGRYFGALRYLPLTDSRLTSAGRIVAQTHYPEMDLSAGLGVASTSLLELSHRWITAGSIEQRVWRGIALAANLGLQGLRARTAQTREP